MLDLANAVKHRTLHKVPDRRDLHVTDAGAANSYNYVRPGWFSADWFAPNWFPSGIVIEKNGTKHDLGAIVDAVVAMWEKQFGIAGG